MTMYRWVEHTGELELEIESASQEGVFREAVAAVGELLGDEDDPPDGPRVEREIAVSEVDRARLLAAWLAELAFVAETEGLVADEVRRLRLGESTLDAVLLAHRADPPHLIKAVTYHRLSFEQGGGGWRARAVLDV